MTGPPVTGPAAAGPVTALADRLVAVDWSVEWPDGPDRVRSRVALFKEFCRRSAWWLDHFGRPGGGPFLDVAALAGGDVRAGAGTVERVREALPPYLSTSQAAAKMCLAALDFAALREHGAELPDLPDPYDPLVHLFERGGAFYQDCSGVFIEIGGAAVPRRAFRGTLVAEPCAPLDHALLDELDRRR
ncbi:hypothetical protein [Spirillospora sp. NPDC029432]|uniref:hypothetical protein n=1 Tax=Spirillospora sp. NPDC029432 TaxID=3154599 RepID=UPI0034521974